MGKLEISLLNLQLLANYKETNNTNFDPLDWHGKTTLNGPIIFFIFITNTELMTIKFVLITFFRNINSGDSLESKKGDGSSSQWCRCVIIINILKACKAFFKNNKKTYRDPILLLSPLIKFITNYKNSFHRSTQ